MIYLLITLILYAGIPFAVAFCVAYVVNMIALKRVKNRAKLAKTPIITEDYE